MIGNILLLLNIFGKISRIYKLNIRSHLVLFRAFDGCLSKLTNDFSLFINNGNQITGTFNFLLFAVAKKCNFLQFVVH